MFAFTIDKKNSPMKKMLSISMIALLFLAACTSAPDADSAKTNDKQEAAAVSGNTYSVDTTASQVEWVGTKQTGRHNGDFGINEGKLSVENGQLSGGNFVINVASLEVKDLEGEDKAKLEGHLKSPDFFQADKFPTALFEITSVEALDASKTSSTLPGATHLISGNLTLKDSTKNVTFPAIINVSENAVTAQADFNIDRTEWGISYKGPNNPQDWMIKKEVNLKVNLKAAQKDNLQAKLDDTK
jgi:polyisoprenoid-binding protein YceI